MRGQPQLHKSVRRKGIRASAVKAFVLISAVLILCGYLLLVARLPSVAEPSSVHGNSDLVPLEEAQQSGHQPDQEMVIPVPNKPNTDNDGVGLDQDAIISVRDNPISANDGVHLNVRHHRREVQTNNTHMFYNVYLNKDSPEARRRSEFIVHDQVRQIANSTVRNNTIYYNMISGRWLNTICDEQTQLDCQRMRYYKQGFEELTLQQLHNYCLNHTDEKVIYIHNKGSFRKERGNTKIRRLSTTAVTSHACLEMPLSSQYPCNVCGLTFQTLPYFHMTANMWVAECSYISKLVPPKLYTRRRRDLLTKLWNEHPECVNPGNKHAWNWTSLDFLKQFGLGRYAMERWLASHPDLVPCDVIPFRLARFKNGFEDWFNPTLYPSRHLQWDIANDTDVIWTMIQEYRHLYGVDEPNFAFMNHTRALRQRERGGECSF